MAKASIEEIKQFLELEDENLRLQPWHLGIQSLSPFAPHDSSQRLMMSGQQLGQTVSLLQGDEQLLQSGMELELGNYTHSKAFENESVVLGVVERYGGYGDDAIPITEIVVFFYDTKKDEIDCMSIPYYFSVHSTWFGFKYAIDQDLLDYIKSKQYVTVEAGTILADTPNKGKLGEYKFGLNTNTLMLSIPEVSEDAAIISASYAQRLAYQIFERRSISYGRDMFPLNIYGDKDNYKAFPDIGEYISGNGVLMALRKRSDSSEGDLYSTAISSRVSLRSHDYRFDKVYYVRGGGVQKEILGKVYDSGTVVDIHAINNQSRTKKDIFLNTNSGFDKYANGCRDFYIKIDETVRMIKSDKKFGKKPLSNRLNNLWYRALCLGNPNNDKIKYTKRRVDLDYYDIDFIVQHIIIPSEGSKITDLHGCKSVIGAVWDDDKMPVDQYGNVADVIVCPTAPFNRMNVGRLYEQYFNAMTVEVEKKVRQSLKLNDDKIIINTPEEIKQNFTYINNYLKYYDSPMYHGYKEILDKNDIEAMKEVLYDVYHNHLYLYIPLGQKKEIFVSLLELLESEYKVEKKPILLRHLDKPKYTIYPCIIAPIYHILLCKTPDELSVCFSPKVNNFKFAIRSLNNENKHCSPVRFFPVRIFGETEVRIVSVYLDREGLAEIRQIANGLDTHKTLCELMLRDPTPTNIDTVVDRDVAGYEDDTAVTLVKMLFNSMGMDFVYVEDKHRFHDTVPEDEKIIALLEDTIADDE